MTENKDIRPFHEKHPRINTLISLLVLMGLGYLAYSIISYILEKLGILLSRLSTMTSNLDAVVVVALITGSVSIVSVVFSSVIAKIIEYNQKRREYLYQKREEPYGDFVEVVYKLLDKTKRNEEYPEAEMTADINKFSKKLTLWGSNRVIKKWLKFREATTGKQPDAATTLFVMEDILFAMRKDFGLRKMKRGNLLAFFINDVESITKHMKR